MLDNVTEGGATTAVSTEMVRTFEGKEIGGYPFFRIDLEEAIRKEIKFEDPTLDEGEIGRRAQEQLSVGGYDGVEVPSYQGNNGVYLVLEPDQHTENGYAAYMAAFPSEDRFQLLRQQNPEFEQYKSVRDYMEKVIKSFALPIGTVHDSTKEGMYQERNMYVPFSSHSLGEAGIQTPLSAMVDQIIVGISSKQ